MNLQNGDDMYMANHGRQLILKVKLKLHQQEIQASKRGRLNYRLASFHFFLKDMKRLLVS